MDEPTVFIIDDDVNTRLSIGALVQSMNVRTECFESAELFLAADLLNRPGCVVTDLRMLGLSGLDLLEILAGSETALQIVVITAYASIPDAVRAVQCGAISFLEKSCQERELWQAINVALSKNNTLRLATQQKELDNSALASLTADEQIVLKLIAKGQSNKQVGSSSSDISKA